jgi:hypothetical protein
MLLFMRIIFLPNIKLHIIYPWLGLCMLDLVYDTCLLGTQIPKKWYVMYQVRIPEVYDE